MTGGRRSYTALAALLLLFLLLMLPNAAWAWLTGHRGAMFAVQLPLAVLLTLGWFALFGRALWLACLLLAPLALVMPLEFHYILGYHMPTSVSVANVMSVTTSAEVVQHFGAALIPLALACLASVVVALSAARLAWRAKLRWTGRVRGILAGVAILILVVPAVAGAFKGIRGGNLAAVVNAAGADEAQQLVKWVEPGYPFGVPVRLWQFFRNRAALGPKVAQLAKFRFGARLLTPLPSRQVYVLVIGESSRRDHWSLFGYDRPTNPELSREGNLITIPHMVSAYPETSGALPVMLTRKPATMKSWIMWPEPSIVEAMNEAGFETWWVTNQYDVTRYQSSALVAYAREADHLERLNTAKWTSQGSLDGDLVTHLKSALAKSTGNAFVVLHMLGSHETYDYRYPPAFARFKPTESMNDASVPGWQRTVNSYDNTILYTDHVLAQIIDVLKNSGATTALWYASDHGETLPSPTCNERSHGHENRPDYEIPALFWYSEAYASAFPRRVATLRDNAGKRTMSENEFPSLLDMAGVGLPGHSKREDWSLFSPTWRYHPRWVNQSRRLDFDRAGVEGGCQALVPAAGGEGQR